MKKFTGPYKVLLVLGRRTGAHLEDWFIHCPLILVVPGTTEDVIMNSCCGEVYSIKLLLNCPP